jgi:hypothetical protein
LQVLLLLLQNMVVRTAQLGWGRCNDVEVLPCCCMLEAAVMTIWCRMQLPVHAGKQARQDATNQYTCVNKTLMKNVLQSSRVLLQVACMGGALQHLHCEMLRDTCFAALVLAGW